MKCASVPSAYRNCILRASVRTARNFSPARNVRSITLPSEARRSFVRTNAPPLPGLTCWNSRTLKIVPSTSMWFPFLNWLVEIMCAPQCRRRRWAPMVRAVRLAFVVCLVALATAPAQGATTVRYGTDQGGPLLADVYPPAHHGRIAVITVHGGAW